MDLYILDSSLAPIAIIDSYASLIWTKRYYSPGDFELYIPANKNLLNYLQMGNFIKREDDNTVMIIEKIQIKTDVENGDFFTITGRSLESIIARRIFIRQMQFSGTIAQVIHQAIYDNFIIVDLPSTSNRTIPNFVIGEMCETSEIITQQVSYENVAEWLEAICRAYSYGWRIIVNSNNKMEFQLYSGRETEVIFSDEFDNLITTEYVISKENYKTYASVLGEGEGLDRKRWNVDITRDEGLDRFELYVDARDISSNDGTISITDYNKLLKERGYEKLKEHSVTRAFSGEVEPSTTYKYKVDYNLGDIITVQTSYGIGAHPRIVEIIENWDESGYKVVPTFEEMEVDSELTGVLLKDSNGYILKDSAGAFIRVGG